MRCYLHPEVAEPSSNLGEFRSIGLPLFTWCSVIRNDYLNLTMPRALISNTNYYMIHVRERRRASFIKLPELPIRYEFLFEIFDKTNLAYDTFITNAYGKMRTTKFLHYTTTSDTYDTVELTFSPYHTMNQAALPS
jgi:hypothetical protein